MQICCFLLPWLQLPESKLWRVQKPLSFPKRSPIPVIWLRSLRQRLLLENRLLPTGSVRPEAGKCWARGSENEVLEGENVIFGGGGWWGGGRSPGCVAEGLPALRSRAGRWPWGISLAGKAPGEQRALMAGKGGCDLPPGQGHDGQDLLETPKVNGELFSSNPILCWVWDRRCLQPPSFPVDRQAAPSSQPFFPPSRQNNKLSPFLGLLPSFPGSPRLFHHAIKK